MWRVLAFWGNIVAEVFGQVDTAQLFLPESDLFTWTENKATFAGHFLVSVCHKFNIL
jgi:hypothetical protein